MKRRNRSRDRKSPRQDSASGDSTSESEFSNCRSSSDAESETDTPSPPSPEKFNYGSVVPKHQDFLVAWSTVAGYVSKRDHEEGSYFIQTLCQELQKAKNNFSLEFSSLTDVLMRVNNAIHEKRMQKRKKTVQTSCNYNALKKPIYFPPFKQMYVRFSKPFS